MENEDMENEDMNKLKRSIARLCTEKEEYVPRNGYSGRGMYGKESPFAFLSCVSPSSIIGEKLLKKGLLVDNLGKGWIYYLP
jgi:hypothetical protein